MGAAQAIMPWLKSAGAWLMKSTAGQTVVSSAAGAVANKLLTPKIDMPDIPDVNKSAGAPATEAQGNANEAARQARRKNAMRQGMAATIKNKQNMLGNSNAAAGSNNSQKTLLGQ